MRRAFSLLLLLPGAVLIGIALGELHLRLDASFPGWLRDAWGIK